jgi:SAM-dependent methyltransferase
MNNLINKDFRQELLRVDVIPRQLNEVTNKYKKLMLEELQNGKIKTEEVTVCQCGSNKLEQLTKIDRFGLPFGSFICQDCGLILTSPRIQQSSLSYYYNKFYHPLNYGKESIKDNTALFAVGQGKKIYHLVEQYLPKDKNLVVLEIGAGTGNVLKEFKEEASLNNYVVYETGTEYSDDCIEKCLVNKINVVYGDLESISKENKKYDLIILSHVFEHFINIDIELKLINNLLSDSGILYIEVPGMLVTHKKPYYNFSFLGYSIHAHIYNFTQNTLARIVEFYGYQIVYGNEEVELILQKGSQKINKSNEYLKIMHYLSFLYDNYVYFNGLNSQLLFSKDKIKKLNTQVENRNTQIKKLNTQIENRETQIKKLNTQVENRETQIKKLNTQVENRETQIKKLNTQVENRDRKLSTISSYIKEMNETLFYFHPIKKLRLLIGLGNRIMNELKK